MLSGFHGGRACKKLQTPSIFVAQEFDTTGSAPMSLFINFSTIVAKPLAVSYWFLPQLSVCLHHSSLHFSSELGLLSDDLSNGLKEGIGYIFINFR